MSREEEIVQAANENYPSLDSEKSYEGFKDGAKWADQHPREGLWDSEKVCKCLYEKIIDVTYLNKDNTNEHYDKYEFIEDLRKAIEE